MSTLLCEKVENTKKGKVSKACAKTVHTSRAPWASTAALLRNSGGHKKLALLVVLTSLAHVQHPHRTMGVSGYVAYRPQWPKSFFLHFLLDF